MPVQRGSQQGNYRGHGQSFYQGGLNQRGAPPSRGSGTKDNFVPPGPLSVLVNCFEITSLPQILYYQYDVITPEVFNRARCSQIIDRLQNHVRPDLFRNRAIYDGSKILYAAGRPLQLVNGEGQSFTVNMSDTGSKIYTVKLSPINTNEGVNVGALRDIVTDVNAYRKRLEAIEPTTVLQLLIRAAPNLGTSGRGMDIHQVRNARAYYTDVNKSQIGGGLELWQGFFQSARPAVGRMLVNIDTSTSAMYMSGHLIDVAMNALAITDIRNLRLREKVEGFRMLRNFLKGVFVLVDIHGDRVPAPNSRKKKIVDIISFVALEQYSFVKDGVPTTVKDYFKRTYSKNIAVSPFGVVTGNKDRPAIIPAQFCWVIPGQFYKKKVPSQYTDEVVRFATKTPADRLRTIMGGIGHDTMTHRLSAPTLEYKTSHFITAAGMSVSGQPVQIDGEILQPPQLNFFGQTAQMPQNGVWNVMNKHLHIPQQLGRWAIVDLTGRKDGGDARNRFIKELEGCLRNLGMLRNPTPLDTISGSGYAAAKLLQSASDNGASFMLVILPERAEEVRNLVKHTSDVVLGVPTQCIKEDKMAGANNQYCNNLALKINARLGGVNSIPMSPFLKELKQVPFMIFGADASHPGPGIRNQPSIASLVWSTDETATRYAAISGVQEPGQEMILALESMLTYALASFVKSSTRPPCRMIFFRDGLSNSQFEEIGAKEIRVIDKVIQKNRVYWTTHNLSPPHVTFVVVGKRHHIRFFPIDGRGADRKGNVQAGFLAEEGLKSPFTRDYFLQSHGGLLGTSRPSHYTVLRDDCFHKKPQLLQELSFALCHCYASATRSVSIPAPTYYADKVCQRAKFHYTPEIDDSSVSVSSDAMFDLPYWQDRYKPLHKRLANTMYFV